ncbi:uncharacterized protein LOC142469435 [Ascaphus truei]|uniref:uncharacterized protein LOC142469435 n=1 Tax=Ascaphus truei TaxID=8439 RepID=UPI003F5ABC09
MSQIFAFRANRNIDIDSIFRDEDSPAQIDAKSDDMYVLADKLETLLLKETKQLWDAITLEKYIEQKRIPRGLRIFKPPTTDFQSEEFILEWNRLLDNCSFELMRLLISKRKIALQKLDGEINGMKEQFAKFQNNSELSVVEERIKCKLDSVQRDIIAGKQSKFQRDRIDYKTGSYRSWKTKTNYKDKHRDPKANTPKNYSHKIPNHYRKSIPETKDKVPNPVQFITPKPKRIATRPKSYRDNTVNSKPPSPVPKTSHLDKEIDSIFEEYHHSNKYQPLVDFELEQQASTTNRDDKSSSSTFSFSDWRKTREQQNAREAIKDLLGREGTSRDRKRKGTVEEQEEVARQGKLHKR